MVRRHGDYLLGHLRVFADERQLQGRVVRVAGQAVFGPTYELEYRGFDGVPGRIGVQQDVLREFEFAPGNPWEASYAVRVGWHGGPAVEGLLLTAREPLVVDGSAVAEARRESSRHGQARMTGLIRQGLAHVPSGSQQLLFIVALALAVGTWWGLVKVPGRGVVVTRAGHARWSMAAARFRSGRDTAVAAGRFGSGRDAAVAAGRFGSGRDAAVAAGRFGSGRDAAVAAGRFGSGRDAAVAAGRLRSGRHAAAAEGCLGDAPQARP